MDNFGTRDLFLETLTKIGCQYEIDNDPDERIYFAYQGEKFTVFAKNEHSYIQIWDMRWGYVPLNNIREIERMKMAINKSNEENSVTTLYSIDRDGENALIHGKAIVLFIPQIPYIEDYLRRNLYEFFRAQHFVMELIVKSREQEKTNYDENIN